MRIFARKSGNRNPKPSMNYPETLDYLFSQLPMYQRQGGPALKKDLSNTLALCELLNQPQAQFRSIHVAGTNGKGSVCHMLASIFQSAGYKVGLYTSPHLKDFRERVRIDGRMIGKEEVIGFVERNRPHFERISPSFFEMSVALAFHHFAENSVELAIIETGLGGRLDSTNVLTPELSVITNIGYDHQQFLGEALKDIASEKAGIIKKGVPVIIGEFQQETAELFEDHARSTGSMLRFADREWEIRKQEQTNGHLSIALRHYDGMELNAESQLTGPHQHKNLITTLATARMLIEMGWDVTRQHFKEGARTVTDRTGLKGRWQTLDTDPTIICDNAHNREALIPNVQRLLSEHDEEDLHFVWGMVNDKDTHAILQLLPKRAAYYFCRPDVPRGMDTHLLQEGAERLGLKSTEHDSVRAALSAAMKATSENGLIYVGGSTFVVAEIL